jgi:hypothetical protein
MIHWKALMRDKIYIPTGRVLMIVVSMWSIIIMEDVGVRLLMLSGVVCVAGGLLVLYMKTNIHL